jgi:hypothetical protein
VTAIPAGTDRQRGLPRLLVHLLLSIRFCRRRVGQRTHEPHLGRAPYTGKMHGMQVAHTGPPHHRRPETLADASCDGCAPYLPTCGPFQGSGQTPAARAGVPHSKDLPDCGV